MSKKIRPSLKDYLKTGEVRMEVADSTSDGVSVRENEMPPKTSNSLNSKVKPVTKTSVSKKKTPKTIPPQENKTKLEPEEKSPELDSRTIDFLEFLSPSDRETWEPILRAVVELQILPIDFVALREDFRTMDRNRFTYYILDQKGEPLRPIRTSVQIREPLTFLIKWDEMGILTLYAPEGHLQDYKE